MDLFPTDAWVDLDTSPELRDWQAIELEGPGLVDQVIETLSSPLHRFTLTYDARDSVRADQVLSFFDACRGPAVKFWFYSFNHDAVVRNLNCGTVAAVSTLLVPFGPAGVRRDDIIAPAVMVNGAALAAGAWSWGTPEAVIPYRSRINFTAPQTGAVTLTAAGRRLYKVRFDCKEPVTVTSKTFGYGYQFKLKEVV